MKQEDYQGEDGLLYCGKCHSRKQLKIVLFGKEQIVSSLCHCEEERIKKEEEIKRKKEEMQRIGRLKASCIHDRALLQCTFSRDDGSLPQIGSAKRYVETWETRKENNDGLLLWGPVGTGKTFYAGCIANALIERNVPVLMTNFSKILNRMSGLYSDDRNVYVSQIVKYPLLIIDDFGIERNSAYALEQVYNIIDERYKARLPLIVTTNLSLYTLKTPPDTMHQRIYDRVLSMCVPVKFDGASHRRPEAEKKYRECRALFV